MENKFLINRQEACLCVDWSGHWSVADLVWSVVTQEVNAVNWMCATKTFPTIKLQSTIHMGRVFDMWWCNDLVGNFIHSLTQCLSLCIHVLDKSKYTLQKRCSKDESQSKVLRSVWRRRCRRRKEGHLESDKGTSTWITKEQRWDEQPLVASVLSS